MSGLPTPSIPQALYVWLVPSEQVLEQPGSWRIRKWDTAPFPEANYTLSASSEKREPSTAQEWYEQFGPGKQAAPSAKKEMPEFVADLLEALTTYEQADEQGVYCKVSRQAVDEAVALIEARYSHG